MVAQSHSYQRISQDGKLTMQELYGNLKEHELKVKKYKKKIVMKRRRDH